MPLRPMLATLADAPLADPQWVYEPKYDGIRAIVEIANGRARLWSRNGNEKTRQFPEVVAALERWSARRKTPLTLDGEIVALDARGVPTSFLQLQGRLQLEHLGVARSDGPRHGVAFIAFDLVRDGARDVSARPLTERREALEHLLSEWTAAGVLRLSEQVRGDGRALYQRALDGGWEGLIAKRADSKYVTGKRSTDWRKLKIVQEQEFVIGAWTEPRESRTHFGSLALGVYEPASHQPPATSPRPRPSRQPPATSHLSYVGQVGTGFDAKELARLMKLLAPLETRVCPFAEAPKIPERAHWVKPTLVAQVKFAEWTNDGKLRHPVYLGLRDDKKPVEVRREAKAQLSAASHRDLGAADIVEQLRALEDARRAGVISLPDGGSLKVTNLHKLFWPKLELTKGDLLRYYARVAPAVLPVIADRALVMKRYPNGIAGKWFYQHRAPDDVPAGVRVEQIREPQIIGGNLTTLLYTAQLAAISLDPWFSRAAHPQFADFAALDLDPGPGVPFAQVLDVARWIHEALDKVGTPGFAKTSGADGLHVYVPLPPGTPYEAGLILCQIVATMVVQNHPRAATTERAVKKRTAGVYIDCLQNMQGKTLAGAYSARASEYAGVSAPVSWHEVEAGFDREDFTIASVPARIDAVGDLWAELRASPGVNLERVARLK